MAKTFSAQVDRWVSSSRARTEAVVKTAIQSLAEEANRPTGQGGRLPLDTGFLRNSFTGQVGSMPSGPSHRGEAMGRAEDVYLVIANMRIGQVLYLGWTANYAKYMEARYAFRDAASQRWPRFVAAAVQEAKARIR